MEPETPVRAIPRPIQRSHTTPASSSTLRAPTSERKAAQSSEEKVIAILDALGKIRWTVPKFLAELFKYSDAPGDTQVNRTVTSILNGTAKPNMATVFEIIYKRSLKVDFKKSDTTVKPGSNMFNPDLRPSDIAHATPALTTWAVRRAADVVDSEAQEMVDEKTGLHLRARVKVGSRYESNQISWEAVQHFSFKHLQEIADDNSPAMTFLLNAYTNKGFLETEKEGQEMSVRQRRPQNLVSFRHLPAFFGASTHPINRCP